MLSLRSTSTISTLRRPKRMTSADPVRSESVGEAGHLLVVGAGPGIGAATARRFAAEGYRITLLARHPHRLEHVADDLRSLGSTVRTIKADASDPEHLRSVLTEIFANPPQPNVVLYNAAHLSPDDLLTTTSQNLMTSYAVNVVGAVVTAQVAAASMHLAGGGTVLLTGGGLADDLQPGLATLSLGKLGLRAVARILGKQLPDEKIRVITVTVNGMVASGTPFDPDHIAEQYWLLTHAESGPGFVEAPFDGV
jgi:NAD(P)-dependent dehydrogenase (short-subunit alcohol dehydrogenase family)